MNIKEFQNNEYKITPIKMSNDGIIDHVMPPLPTYYNFFILIVGKPSSGKSNLWLNLINQRKKNTYYKKFDRVLIFSNSLHNITCKIKLPDDRMFHGIDKLEETINEIDATDDKVLIILDDVVTDITDSDYIQKLIFNRRHKGGGISLIVVTQVYNKLKLPLRKCATDVVLFSTSNKRELDSVFADFINVPKDTFLNIAQYCFKKDNHQFVWIDNTLNRFYHNFNLLEFA